MTVTSKYILLAYLLSLRDYSESLTPKDKENLNEFAKEFRAYPQEWESHVEPFLMAKIAENPQLNQLFTTYKDKLNQSDKIPLDLLPNLDSFYQLEKTLNSNPLQQARSEIPNLPDDTTPEGQAELLNNFAILISESEQPENTANQLTWLDKLKQWLS
ncbi:MAG TPA: hypothetical protein DCF68_21875 [Cyanothece sp. UBA12306]|nr:hypothetical protein [Cyanothece sp. UBA12306]